MSSKAASSKAKRRVLLLTPPLLQPNTPYPATMYLKAHLDSIGVKCEQVDLSIKVVRDILAQFGGNEAEEILELLSSDAPIESKIEAANWVSDLASGICAEVDEGFGFSRYSEYLSASLRVFKELAKLIRKRGVIDEPLEKHLFLAVQKFRPTEVWVTCPFPGTLVGAFKIASYLSKNFPNIKRVIGGGYVSTELRHMTDKRPYKFFDEFVFDSPIKVPFIAPSYDGIDMQEYFDMPTETDLVSRLWCSGRWKKLQMANGCYWHKCAFCDVRLSYIGKFSMPTPGEIVDAMEGLGDKFHFVDEAMPPKLVRGVCEEILRRNFTCTWWGNVRFDAAFTPELTKLMAKAGCIAVTGGLECACDRLLKLMNKGITLKSAEKVLKAFKASKIGVHAYLMYDFPTETKREFSEAKKYVQSLVSRGLVSTYYWHRFGLTVHSPIYAAPEQFKIEVEPIPKGRLFALNEVGYRKASSRKATKK